MAYKEREKPRILCIYEALAKRMKLGPGDQYYLLHMDGGFVGECGLDVHTDTLDSRCLVLNDLQLRHNRVSIQIDTLVICPDKLLVYETKNHKGDHLWGPLTFRKPSGATMENPSLQLNRTMARLGVLLAELKIEMPIEGFVVFINPEFNLLSNRKIEEYLLPGQIPRHFQNFRVKGEIRPEQQRLADALIRMHNPRHFSEELPEIDYGKLRKELFCLDCGSAVRLDGVKSVYCPVCKKRRRTTKTILHNVEEFRLLFPDAKVTTPRMAEWCGMDNKDRIYRVLCKNYTAVGKCHGRHYV
jgi:hypothetical protein